MRVLLQNNQKSIMLGLVKIYVMQCPFWWTTLLFDFGTSLHRQVVQIPMGTTSAPLVANLFLFCDNWDFMMSLF